MVNLFSNTIKLEYTFEVPNNLYVLFADDIISTISSLPVLNKVCEQFSSINYDVDIL